MEKKEVSPASILKLTTGHWALKALTVAVDLSVFTNLKEKSLTYIELSKKLNIPMNSLERLLNANVALGFLEKVGDKYSNTDIASVYLIEGLPNYLGDFVKLSGKYGFDKWTHFKDSIINNKPIEDLEDDFHQNDERMQYFIKAMHNNAKEPAKLLSNLPYFNNGTHLLDIGGGSGAYSISLVGKYPNLKATLIDLPPVCKVAKEFVNDSKFKNKITIKEADVLKEKIEEKGDIILLSQVLHNLSEKQSEELIKRCYNWTLPNGIIIVHEFVLDDDEISPLYSTLFSLNMLVTTKDGNVYTKKQLITWLEDAGYVEIEYRNTYGPSTFIIGRKNK